MDMVHPLIQEWNLESLVFSRELGEKKQSLPKIIEIRFPFLDLLRFYSCAIESLEGLSRTWMPRLSSLELSKTINIKWTTIS